MLKIFKKFFKKTNKKIKKNKQQLLIENKKINKMNKNRKFEIEIFDENLLDSGQINLRSLGIQTVEASSPQELFQLYAGCGQRIKILKEITQTTNSLQKFQKNNPIEKKEIDFLNKKEQEAQNEKKEPIFYYIDGIEIKNENGKIFHKKWVKLNEIDLENFRITNLKTKKLISLENKNVEIKKWVLVKNDLNYKDKKFNDDFLND